jgi:ferri-bacillibactin esterase
VTEVRYSIGYPIEDLVEWRNRRRSDLTPTPALNPETPDQRLEGSGDTFLRIIEEELKPFVESRHRLDRSNQTVFGMSYGGLIAVHSLFRNPTAFGTHIIASPSIPRNDGDVLMDEAAFSKRARAGEFQLKVLLTSAGDEQNGMVDSAKGLAQRLATLNPAKISVTSTASTVRFTTPCRPQP